MQTRQTTVRALIRFALVAAATTAAAALWAQNRPEQGLLLDAQTWNEEVITASTGPWPENGWYRIVTSEDGVEVRAVKPSDRATSHVDALFFRMKGTTLKTGMRPSYRYMEVLQQPRVGRDHEMALGMTRFSIRVEEVPAGVQYAIGYGGHTYDYILGPQGSSTSVRAVADLDGDARPDFVIDVNDETTYLLLSTKAQAGPNLPTAELPAHCGV
jgi:hypothetical protein